MKKLLSFPLVPVLTCAALVMGPPFGQAQTATQPTAASSPAAQAPVLRLTLRDAETRALDTSSVLASLRQDFDAARAEARARRSYLAPEVRLEASGHYQAEVNELDIPIPGMEKQKLGDNWGYSVGPKLEYNLYDQGALRKAWKSSKERSLAKRQEYEAARKRIIFETRFAYFQVQLALEQPRLLADRLKLDRAQYRDIRLGLEAGTKSRIDLLMAHQEVLARRKQFRHARADLSVALRDLFRLTGWGEGTDASLPIDSRMAESLPGDTAPATAYVTMDPIPVSAASLEGAVSQGPDPAHPSLASWDKLEQSWKLASESFQARRWPSLTLSAKTSLDYPRNSDLSDYWQHTVGLFASLPIFEWGRTGDRAKEAQGKALSAQERRRDARKDLWRDWNKAMDRLQNLRTQQGLDNTNVTEAEELASLVYASYKAGRSTFLEVQSSNVRALEAKVVAVRTDVQLLIQLAVLSSLAKG